MLEAHGDPRDPLDTESGGSNECDASDLSVNVVEVYINP